MVEECGFEGREFEDERPDDEETGDTEEGGFEDDRVEGDWRNLNRLRKENRCRTDPGTCRAVEDDMVEED